MRARILAAPLIAFALLGAAAPAALAQAGGAWPGDVPAANDVLPGADDLLPGADDLLPGADDLLPGADEALPGLDDVLPDPAPGVPEVDPAEALIYRGPSTGRRGRMAIPGKVARLGADGLARAPRLAPRAVKRAIWAANDLQRKPYVWGGGHAGWLARGYDCSGAVSYALHAGALLSAPRTSGGLMRWGAAGAGTWITVHTHATHAFMVIAGLRLDTSPAGDPTGARGPRWRLFERRTAGFKRRHPVGL
jgi:hypothetical protein